MIALVTAVFVASLLGSVHCAGMCGAFLAFAVSTGETSVRTKASLHAAYNCGRLLTYSVLGAVAGSIGAALDLGGSLVGLQQGAAVLAGSMMVTIGIVSILRAFGVRIGKVPVPPVMQRLALKGHRAAGALNPTSRALATGLLTTLLPCGWLYAFVITAAGTGHPVWGAATMAVFWLGTLPIMIGLGIGLQKLTGSLRRHLPLATSILIVAVGLWTVAGRWTIVGLPTPAAAAGTPAVTRVKNLDPHKTCPLCE